MLRRTLLASLRCDKSLIVFTRVWNDLDTVLKSTIQGIGQNGGEARGQKIDIKLQVALRIQAVNH